MAAVDPFLNSQSQLELLVIIASTVSWRGAYLSVQQVPRDIVAKQTRVEKRNKKFKKNCTGRKEKVGSCAGCSDSMGV